MSYSDVRLSFSYQCKIQKSRQIILNTVLLIILGLGTIKLKYNMIIYKHCQDYNVQLTRICAWHWKRKKKSTLAKTPV